MAIKEPKCLLTMQFFNVWVRRKVCKTLLVFHGKLYTTCLMKRLSKFFKVNYVEIIFRYIQFAYELTLLLIYRTRSSRNEGQPNAKSVHLCLLLNSFRPARVFSKQVCLRSERIVSSRFRGIAICSDCFQRLSPSLLCNKVWNI